MLSLSRTLTTNYLARHVTRTALVVVTIALGVAVLVATQSLSRGLKDAAHRGFNPLAGLADLLIVNGETGVPASLANQLNNAQINGVKDAAPAVMAHVAVADLKNRSVLLFGLGVNREEMLAGAQKDGLEIRIKSTYQGGLVGHARELWAGNTLAFVDEGLAADVRAVNPKDPDHFALRCGGKKRTVTILGTVALENVKTSEHVILTDPLSASSLVFPDTPGTVGRIHVRLTPGANSDEVSARLRDWLGNRGTVKTQEEFRAVVSEVTGGLELGLAIGGAGALVVGLFLVYNVLSVGVAERRHDIGILRSVGATRGQVASLFVLEAAGLGLLGSALGLPLGVALAWGLLRRTSAVVSDLLVRTEDPQVHLSLSLLLFALAAGTATAVLAALVPALQAAGEEPADAVRRVPRRSAMLMMVTNVGGAMCLVLLGVLCVQFRTSLPPRFGVFAGIVCIVLGSMVATPLLSSLVGRVIQPLFRHLMGLGGRLAADNLARSPGRTGLVIAALAATGGLLVMTAGFVRSSEDAVTGWIAEKVGADLFVTSGAELTSGSGALPMDEGLQKSILTLPEVEAVVAVRYTLVDFRGHQVFLIGVDMSGFDPASERALARNLGRFPRFRERGTCLVSENFAARHRLFPGDRFTVPGKEGRPLELEVLGAVEDYTWNWGTVLVDRAWYRDEFDHQVDVMDVFLRSESRSKVDAVRETITERWGEQSVLFVRKQSEIEGELRSQVRRVYSLAYAQQAVVGMVALLGVVVALTISVLQRRRELGLLRAVGASRGQILRSVLAEAVLMGVTGAMVGFLIGLMLEWYVLQVMLLDEAGFIFPLKVPWTEAAVVFALSVVCATLAGLWPAYHATQLRIPDAIAYE
jgi:putative ABC transport system permease protein